MSQLESNSYRDNDQDDNKRIVPCIMDHNSTFFFLEKLVNRINGRKCLNVSCLFEENTSFLNMRFVTTLFQQVKSFQQMKRYSVIMLTILSEVIK